MEIEIKEEEVKDTHDTEDNGIAKEEAHDGPKIAGMGEDTEKQILQEHTVRDISPESIGEETSKSPKEDDKVEETRVETCEELATTTGGEGTEKQNLEEEYPVKNQSTVSVNVETNEESSKEDDMVVKIPKQEGCEIIQTADGGEDTGKHIMEEDNAVRDNFELKVFETTGAGQDTREQIINKINSVEDHSPESIEKETLGASSKEDEEGEGFKTTASSMNTEKQNKEECATPHVSLLSVGEETAIESSNGGESDAVKLKEEVKESYLEFIQQTETRSFMEETKFEALKDRENINKDLEEEMPPKETNKNLVEHSLVSEASAKENKTETSEKEESTVNDSDSALVTIVTDEKCLRDAETEDKKQNLESDDLGKKLECTSESVAEDQSNKPLPEISQTQIEEDNDEGRDQTIESVANESIKDVILTEKVFETTGAGQDAREQIINKIDSVEDHSPESIEKETLGASSKEDEEGEGFKTTASSMNTEKQNKEECATPHVSLLSVGEETAIESSNGGESDAVKLKEEVRLYREAELASKLFHFDCPFSVNFKTYLYSRLRNHI
ncbi:hypothetical protein L1049_002559 [Liquidambar formosana]|uniref:Uncharacterized protein n=1 Tax=Liquidambar formosana TaxID=63359 RepID=A0AAP0R8Z6_LIQFO